MLLGRRLRLGRFRSGFLGARRRGWIGLAPLLFDAVGGRDQDEAELTRRASDNALILQVLEPLLHRLERITAARLVTTPLGGFVQLPRRHRFLLFTKEGDDQFAQSGLTSTRR